MIKTETFQRIADTFGTPTYVYEEELFGARVSAIADAIFWRPLEILYAIKANSNLHIVRLLASQKLSNGATFGVDAVSPGEVALALKAGIPKSRVVFNGNNSEGEEIDYVMSRGVLVGIDSLQRFEWYCRKYPGSKVCIRINPNVGAGHHDHCITGGPKSKFGIWYSRARKALEIANKYGVKIVGVQQHIGSQILDPKKFLFAMDVMLDVARIFTDLLYIDFGGGPGVPYKPGVKPLDFQLLGSDMDEKFARFCADYGRRLKLVLEPGRYLVAEAGNLLVQVTTVKRNPDGKVFVGVNSGFNHLARPWAYGSYHEIVNLTNPNGPLRRVIVVGYICESGDKFTPKSRMLAQPRVGDLLLIKNAGAYGYAMASNYNTRPRPPEIMATPLQAIYQIRPRETIKQLIARAQ